jgi:acyl carrier protein
MQPIRAANLLPEGMTKVVQTVRATLADVLGISAERAADFTATTPLFGALPELDSMAVAGVLTELEDRLAIVIEDDEVDGDMLETFGSLVEFAARKALV